MLQILEYVADYILLKKFAQETRPLNTDFVQNSMQVGRGGI